MRTRTEAEIIKNWPEDYDTPFVTVLAVSYCHEKYLHTALDSILSQETNFPFEVIVHDDASPDGSPDIIKEYAERYPHIICPILENENQYSKGVQALMRVLKPYIRGRYIAYLECDDYWTDNNKLQNQVDFLEAHPAFLAVAHNCTVVDADGMPNGEQYPECMDEEYTPEHFFNDILSGQSGTLMMRDIFSQFPEDHPLIMNAPQGPFDRVVNLTLLQNGRVHCIQKSMSAYRHVTDSGHSFSATFRYDIRRDARFFLSFVTYCKRIGRIGDAIGMLRWFISYTEEYSRSGHLSRREKDSLLSFCNTSITSLTDRLLLRSHRCNCCGQLVRYDPVPIDQQEQALSDNDLFLPETLNPDAFLCPSCGSLDRDRLMIAALERMPLAEKENDCRILHIAPSPALSVWIRTRYTKAIYDTCVPDMSGDGFHADLRELSSLPDKTCDLVICSHVMEHVRDDRRAFREMKRILKDGGCILFLVPIDLMFSGIDEAFGQEDSVRRYSRECLLERLEEHFSVQTLGKDFFGEDCFSQLGLSDSSTLYVLTRPGHQAAFSESDISTENLSSGSFANLAVYIQHPGDNCYTEEKSLTKHIPLNRQYNCTVSISSFGEISKLRINPMQQPCILRQIAVTLLTAEGETVAAPIIQTNAYSLRDELFFDSNDPQLEFYIPQGMYQSIFFSCELISYDSGESKDLGDAFYAETRLFKSEADKLKLKEQLESLTEQLTVCSEQLAAAQHDFEVISNSTFWKITGPARATLDIIKNALRLCREHILRQ